MYEVNYNNKYYYYNALYTSTNYTVITRFYNQNKGNLFNHNDTETRDNKNDRSMLQATQQHQLCETVGRGPWLGCK